MMKYSLYSLGQPLVGLWTRFESNTSKIMRSNPAHQLSFISQLENIYDLIKISRLPTVARPILSLLRVIISES